MDTRIDFRRRDYVYLCGAMEGVPPEVMKGWRNLATRRLGEWGISTLDPCRRQAFHAAEEYSQNLSRRIVKMDLRDIHHSQVILANLSKEALAGGRAWGSIAEIAHGHTKNKIIVVVTDPEFIHPFVDFYATEQHHQLEDALDAIIHYYG